jgi:hypothetical protein
MDFVTHSIFTKAKAELNNLITVMIAITVIKIIKKKINLEDKKYQIIH